MRSPLSVLPLHQRRAEGKGERVLGGGGASLPRRSQRRLAEAAGAWSGMRAPCSAASPPKSGPRCGSCRRSGLAAAGFVGRAGAGAWGVLISGTISGAISGSCCVRHEQGLAGARTAATAWATVVAARAAGLPANLLALAVAVAAAAAARHVAGGEVDKRQGIAREAGHGGRQAARQQRQHGATPAASGGTRLSAHEAYDSRRRNIRYSIRGSGAADRATNQQSGAPARAAAPPPPPAMPVVNFR
jgi:hypothetical protein